MDLKYKLIKSKRKTIALEISSDGSLIVRAPRRITEEYIQTVIKNKIDWINAKLDKARSRISFCKPKKFEEGESFLYLGKPFFLKLIDNPKPAVKFDNGFILGSKGVKQASHYFRRWYKQKANEHLIQRVDYFADILGLKYKKVKITSAKKRWGSCSSSGTICFCWRLIMAPVKVIDYVVVHEVIHLDEKNHSKNFWSKVAKAFPEYKDCRRWLKENGYLLNL